MKAKTRRELYVHLGNNIAMVEGIKRHFFDPENWEVIFNCELIIQSLEDAMSLIEKVGFDEPLG